MRILHGVLGFTVWATAKWQIFLQREWTVISFGSHKPLFQFYGVSAICIPLAIFLEIRQRYGKSKALPDTVTKTLHTGDHAGHALKANVTPEQKKIVQLIQRGTPIYQLKADFPHKKVFIFQNSIYDLSDYKHPGGNIFFQNHLWEEVSRYM